jgi:tripartite-type tricarboxylate transporter receptor subunit TctC
MKLPRRQFLHLAVGAAALPVVTRIARAQVYPTRPVRIIIGFSAGGPIDILTRLIGQWLSERLGQPFVIESRPGAGSNIATEAVVRALADGYTLLGVTSANTINTTLYEKLNFNFIRDIAPVAGIIRVPQVIEVHPSVPVTTVPEFIAYAKANPGKLNMASAGNGTVQHVAGELFKVMTGVAMQHVPYRGQAPALVDLLGGQAQVMFDTVPASIQYLRSAKLRPLAVTTATRAEALPELPTVADFVPGYESSALYGIAAPRNTPTEIVDKLNREINTALADPTMKARLADLGGSVLAGSAADFGQLIADETEKWAKVVKFSGAKAD